MTKELTKQEFVEFLKQNGVHPFTFVRRCIQWRFDLSYKERQRFSEYFKYANKPSLISGSFRWKYTPEGLSFWNDLDHEYRKHFKFKYDE